MYPYSKGTWLWITFVMLAMLGLVGIIESDLPQGQLSLVLMLGVVLLGFTSIFAWLYRHRIPSMPVTKRPHEFQFVGQTGNKSIYEWQEVEQAVNTEACCPAPCQSGTCSAGNNASQKVPATTPV